VGGTKLKMPKVRAPPHARGSHRGDPDLRVFGTALARRACFKWRDARGVKLGEPKFLKVAVAERHAGFAGRFSGPVEIDRGRQSIGMGAGAMVDRAIFFTGAHRKAFAAGDQSESGRGAGRDENAAERHRLQYKTDEYRCPPHCALPPRRFPLRFD
jgi:hypothetical protein